LLCRKRTVILKRPRKGRWNSLSTCPFRKFHPALKPGGIATLQAITIHEDHFDDYRGKADIIQRYIFPGGMRPTKTIIANLAEEAGLQFERVAEVGSSYARTLRRP